MKYLIIMLLVFSCGKDDHEEERIEYIKEEMAENEMLCKRTGSDMRFWITECENRRIRCFTKPNGWLACRPKQY